MSELGSLAMIGTRDFLALEERHPEPFRVYRAVACWAGGWRRPVHTGAAPGADQIAAELALGAGGHARLFLPDADFQSTWRRRLHEPGFYDACEIRETIYVPQLHADWTESIDRHHPNPKALSPVARRLMARNYGIVVGTAAVIALPKGAAERDWGGTGQGMRVAAALGIPVYNLWLPEVRERLERTIEKHPCPIPGG